jgi:hypothetical protein
LPNCYFRKNLLFLSEKFTNRKRLQKQPEEETKVQMAKALGSKPYE